MDVSAEPNGSRRQRAFEVVLWVLSPAVLWLAAGFVSFVLGAPMPRTGLVFALVAIALGSVSLYRPQRWLPVGRLRSAGMIYTGLSAVILALVIGSQFNAGASTEGAPSRSVPASTASQRPVERTSDELTSNATATAPARSRYEQDEIERQHRAEAIARERGIAPEDVPTIDTVRPEARAALLEVLSESQLSYFRGWRIYTPVSEMIRALGPPDFVYLSSDRGDVGQELRENGIPRELIWRVQGCAPVRVDVDASGRTIGVDYSSLTNRQLFCTPAMVDALTPPAAFSCERPERRPRCR